MKEVVRNKVVNVLRIGLFCVILAGAVLWIRREAVERQVADPAIESVLSSLREERYPYANDRMVYIPLENGKLEQWTVDGVYQQKVILPAGDDWEPDGGLLWVDNQEIIWTDCVEEDEEDIECVYSTPIERKNGREILLPEQTRKLFVCEGDGIRGSYLDENEFGRGVYVNDSYILYAEDGELLFYDRKQGGELQKPADIDGYIDVPRRTCLASEISNNQVLCHSSSLNGKLRDNVYEFWSYRLGDNQLHKIDGRCCPQAAYVADSVGNKAYYQIADDQSIWEYDLQMGQRREFLSEKQFQACFEKNGLLWDDAYYNDSLFVDGGRLYLIKDQDNPQIFSAALDGGECRYERELTEAVQSSGYSDGWRMDHPDSDLSGDYLGHYLTMLEGKILLYWQEEDEEEEVEQYFLCIDRKTASKKIVTGRDSEKIFFGMIGLWMEPGTTGDWKPSPEKADFAKSHTMSPEHDKSNTRQDADTSDQKNGKSVISPKDQLACISRLANLWMQKKYGDDLTQYYAVTDLDHNGRLEIITTSGPQGSGAFSSNHYYQVSADGNSLRQITASIGDIDLLDEMQTVYIDRATDTYYYLAGDYVSGGFGARYCWYGAIVLDSGMLTSRTYAETGMTLSKKEKNEVWYGFSYLDGKEQKIKEEEFDSKKLADRFFDGLEKEQVHFSWFSFKGKKSLSEEKILENVTRSYQDFMKNGTD